MPRTKPKEHARRTRKLRRREITRKLLVKATEANPVSETPKSS